MAPGSGSLNSGDLNDQHRKAWTLEMHMMLHDGTCKIGKIGAFCVHHVWRNKRAHTDEWYFENWCGQTPRLSRLLAFQGLELAAVPRRQYWIISFCFGMISWNFGDAFVVKATSSYPQCFKTVTSFNHWDVPHGKRYMSSTSSKHTFWECRSPRSTGQIEAS